MKKTIRRFAAALCLLLCALYLPQNARASYDCPVPDMERPSALTLAFGYPGVTFRVYRAGDLSQNVILTPGGDFAGYPVSFEGLDSAGWRAMAETLAAYAARDGLKPLAEGVTDGEGRLTFEDLEVGLYLVAGEKLAIPSRDEASGRETTTYITPQPFLICLPNWQSEVDTEWNYDVTAVPKHEVSQEEEVIRRALKVWQDGSGSSRPAQISVQLLRDGQVYDTVALSAENNWRWQWEQLDNQYRWQVVEAAGSEGYHVSVSLQGITFVVTNTLPDNPPPPYNPPPPEDPPPPPPDDTTTTDNNNSPPPEDPETPVTPPVDPPANPPSVPPLPDGEDLDDPNVPLANVDTPEDEPRPSDEEDLDDPDVPLARLPQTGQLWWPVPLLAMGGIFLFLLGCVLRRRGGYEEE